MLSMLKPKALTNTPVPEGSTLQQAHAEILELMGKGHSQHHRIGQLYNYIVEKKLAEKAGFKDARDFASKHLVDLSQSALSLYGAVASAFSEPVARRYGATCLYLLLTYKEAADLEVNAADPGNTPIEVPDEKGQVTTQPFGKCSVEQMRRALLRKRKPASTRPLPAETLALAEQYREAVTGHFPKGVLVKVSVRNQKGKAVLDLWEDTSMGMSSMRNGVHSCAEAPHRGRRFVLAGACQGASCFKNWAPRGEACIHGGAHHLPAGAFSGARSGAGAPRARVRAE